MISFSFDKFVALDLGKVLRRGKLIAVTASRTIQNKENVKKGIWELAHKARHDFGCRIVTGGARGGDQAAMEGSLGVQLGSFSPIIPMSSRNHDKFFPFIASLTGQNPEVDKSACVLTTEGLIVFYPDFRSGYHPGKYNERNKLIVQKGDVVWAFWDGTSSGTKRTVNLAEREMKDIFLILI